jgi:thiamine-monophosphate kinase
MTRVPGEFELIETYFAPLSAGEPGSFGLRNDAAVARVAAGQDVVITSDMLVAGVHFLDDDPANELSAKCLAVNLSDLAAMGARPTGYLLSICWPQAPEEHWIAAFVRGLADLQARYDMHLLGGDTTAGSARLVICVTALGEVPQGLVLTRSGARDGDLVYVSGTLGDAALGLTVLQRQVNADGIGADGGSYLIGRYRLPEPRVALGRALAQRDLASACLDVSDGLLADAGHIAKASGLRLTLEQARVPLSQEAEVLLAQRPDLWPTVLTGGDDYELLFTAGADQASDLEALAVELDLPLTLIGRVEGGQGVGLVGTDGKSTEVGDGGWRHF